MESLKNCDSDSDDNEDEDEISHPERAGCSSSVIVDKYQEDTNATTVANHFARMIINLEARADQVDPQNPLITDPEDNNYPEDDHVEDEDHNLEEIND